MAPWVVIVLGCLLAACGKSAKEGAAELEAKRQADREAEAKAALASAKENEELAKKPAAVLATLAALRERAKAVVAVLDDKPAVAALPACKKGKPRGPRKPALTVGDETVRFLASGKVHPRDKEKGRYDHWDPVQLVSASLGPWADYEREARYQETREKPERSPKDLHHDRELLVGKPSPLLEGHVIVVMPGSDGDPDRLHADVVIIDGSNHALCRIEVEARSRVQVIPLGGGSGTAQQREETVKELRWRMQLAFAATDLPVMPDGEAVEDPTANVARFPPPD